MYNFNTYTGKDLHQQMIFNNKSFYLVAKKLELSKQELWNILKSDKPIEFDKLIWILTTIPLLHVIEDAESYTTLSMKYILRLQEDVKNLSDHLANEKITIRILLNFLKENFHALEKGITDELLSNCLKQSETLINEYLKNNYESD